MTAARILIIFLPVANPHAVADSLVEGMDEDAEWAYWDAAALACGLEAEGEMEFRRARNEKATVSVYNHCGLAVDNSAALAWCRKNLPAYFAD